MSATANAIGVGHLDTLVAYNLAGIEYSENAGDNHGANDALQSLLMTLDREHYLGVLSHHGFMLGLRFAHLVMVAPFADHRVAMREMIEDTIMQYRDAEVLT
jgi:hypothetical protein